MTLPHIPRALLLGALLASSVATAAGTDEAPAPVQGVTVPAALDEKPTSAGPLPVVKTPAKPDAAEKDDALDPGPYAPLEEDAEGGSLFGSMLRMFLVLGVVVALIYVTLNYGLRKMMGVRGAPMGRSRIVHVVERVPLDPKRALFVIEAAGEYLLVGGADDLHLISKLERDEVTRILDQRKQDAAAPSPFLQKLLQRSSASAPVPDERGKTSPAERTGVAGTTASPGSGTTEGVK